MCRAVRHNDSNQMDNWMTDKPKPGTIGWIDLTIEDADGVRDFYKAVAGWESSAVEMGDYNDYCMLPPGQSPVAGICHARGANAGVPASWLIYITVEDLAASIEACESNGGAVLRGPREIGEAKMGVIKDPAGAACALYQP